MKSIPKNPTKVYSIWFLLCFNILSLDITSGESTLQEYVGRTIEHFKLRLHNTLEDNRIRRTRSTFEYDGTEHSEVPNPHINQLESSEGAPSVAVWCLVTVNSTEIVFAGTDDGSISIFYDFELISLHEFSSNEPIYSLLAFQYGNRLWLVALHLEKRNSHFMQVYEYDYNSTINLRQRINLLGDSLISTVTIERTPYLVLVTNKEFKDSNLVLFVWSGTQFDEILTFSLLSKCQYLIAWQIDKVLFLAASLFDKNQLTIWRFAKYYGKLIPVQMFEGNFHILKHLEYAGSDYLVCGMENKVVIFWWSGVTFLKQQEFYSSDSDNITDISILMLSQEETVIISVKKNQLEYFVQGSSISYARTGDKTLDSPTLKRSTLWKDGDGTFYILPVFQDLHPVQVFELDLNFTVLPPFLEITNPQNCSGNFYEVVKEKQDDILELHSKIGKVWRKDKPVLISSVNVQGSVISKKPAGITNVFFSRTSEVPNILSTVSIYDKLNKQVHNLIFAIKDIVRKSADQNITGNVNFVKGIQVKEGNIEELSDHTKINEVHTLAFSSVLKVNGSQAFSNNISLGKACATLISSKILNNINVEDYLLLGKQETILGNLIFQDITVNHMTVVNTAVNDLELSDIVTSSGQQNIQNKKFSFLSSISLTSTGHIAGIKSSELKKIIQNDTPELEMKLNFTSVITIEDITLHTINGLDLMNLFRNSTKMSGNETIRGSKHFYFPVNIKELSVLGQVNELNLNHLMTLNTSQNISNSIKFTNVSFNDIKTHLLNEIDLCSDAILKYGHFKVNQTVKFLKPLEVSFITMKDGVCINYMDVSSYESSLLSPTHYVNSSVEVSSISVLNNVQIDDEDIGSLLYKLATNVWLKTSNQTISEGNFKLLSVKDLSVQTVNGISLDDLALTDGNVAFNSPKDFESVSVKSLIIQDGKTFNNTFITPNVISAIEKMLSILHVVNMTIKGDLIAHAINDEALSNWMHVQRMQICSGINTFETIMLHELQADQVNLNRFNEKDFDSYKKTSVLSFPNKTIFNKAFTHLEGKEMITQGFLNGKEFEKMRKSVVTLNTKQNISNVIFGEIKMKALSIINFDIVDLSKVVSKVTPEYNVSSKKFTGNVTVKNMQLYGKLEEVDVIALQKYALYKGKNNSLLHPVTFLADLKAKTIEIPRYSTIDGIDIDDLIKLNWNFYSNFLHFSTIRLKNVDIYGEINGCDLWDIALPKNYTKIKAVKHLTQLKVDGNLFIESIVNGVPRNKIFEVLSNFDLVNKNLHFSNVIATHLQISDVNDIKVNFLIRDVVKQHELEIIKGKKIFKNKLVSSNTTINALEVGSWLCGLNIPHLYSKYVSKQKKQKIYIRNLHKVEARNVIIMGALNKIKLPDEVVLTYTEEYIPLMNFNSSINMNSDLNIHGTIDDVTLARLVNLVNNRVTVSSSETLMAPLVFLKDVHLKDLVIKGQVNEIMLTNTVKRIGNYTIQGSKTFERNLDLQPYLILRNLINRISIDGLLMNICQNDENEYITSMVNFTGIETSSLNVEFINNVSLDELWNEIDNIEENSQTIIQTFSYINWEVKELFSKVKDEIEDIFPFYGFFELHQVLHLGPTAQFLPIYESGISGDYYELPTSKMIVWVNRNEPCRPYKSFEMDVSPDGILTKTKEFQGRIFPFPLRLYDSDIESFVLHTDRTKSCTNPSRNILKTIFKGRGETINKINVPSNYTVLQAQLLELEEGIYMLMAYTFEGDGDRMFLYEYDSEKDVWSFLYPFHQWDVSSFDVIFISDFLPPGIHLAVTSANHPGIYHYLWDLQDIKFELKTMYPKSVSTAAMWVRNDDYVFLLLAKEKTEIKKEKNWAYVYTEPIEVHVLERDTFELSHTINIKGISSFERFDFDGEMYVLAVSCHLQTIYVLQYRGYNGFEVIQKINAPGVVKVSVFSSTNEDLFLAISSSTGHTRILKCIARGNMDSFDFK